MRGNKMNSLGRDKSTKASYFVANLAVLGFAAAAIIGKKVGAQADIIVWGRTLFASAGLVLLLPFYLKTLAPPTSHSRLLLLSAGITLCMHWYAFFETINVAGVTVALLTFACFPLFVIFFQAIQQLRQINIRDLLSAGLIIIGIYIMVPNAADPQQLTGWLWGFGSALLFAILTLQNQALVKTYNAIQISLFQNGIACLALSLTMVSLTELSNLSVAQWVWLALCGIICTAVAHTLLIRCFNTLPAVQISFIVNLEPVYGLALAIILLKESMTISALMGGTIVIGAIIINTMTPRATKKGDLRTAP